MNCMNCVNFCYQNHNYGECNLCYDTVEIKEKCDDFMKNKYNGDCIEVLDYLIEMGVIADMILIDPPYAKTRGKWDVIIPLDKMWERINKIIKPNGAIVLFGSEPFSSALRMSNLKMYRYDIIWDKTRGTDPMNAKHRPMRCHENISVFYKKKGTYNPQMIKLDKPDVRKNNKTTSSSLWNSNGGIVTSKIYNERYPVTIFRCVNTNQKEKVHPTQKPVKLLEWLIKTYTNEGEVILDNTMGSASTGVACLNTNRKFIGIELDENYFEVAKNRIENTYKELNKKVS